jgi:hypothetical protein
MPRLLARGRRELPIARIQIRRLAPALLAAAAVTAAGCGENRSFVADYNKAVASLDVGATSQGDHASGFDHVATQLQAFRARISALKPPSDARGPFNRLLTAVDRYDADLHRVADASRSGNLGRLQKQTDRLAVDS